MGLWYWLVRFFFLLRKASIGEVWPHNMIFNSEWSGTIGYHVASLSRSFWASSFKCDETFYYWKNTPCTFCSYGTTQLASNTNQESFFPFKHTRSRARRAHHEGWSTGISSSRMSSLPRCTLNAVSSSSNAILITRRSLKSTCCNFLRK